MLEIGPQFSANFRQEILSRFFSYVQSAESFYIVGGAGTGKTRLLDYLTKEDVQKYYLKENSSRFLLVRVDLNRLFAKNESWAFYELMLSSIVLELNKHESNNVIRGELVDLVARVIESRDPLLALRFFEIAVNKLCQGLELKLCFMIDEFDEAYKNFPHEIFSQLRAVRDANKNRVSYVVFLRTLPERLRPPHDTESFYELLSRNMLGIGPYSRADTLQILQQLEVRRNHPLLPAQREHISEASGGHIGLLQAFLSILIEDPQAKQKIGTPGWGEWFGQQPASVEECRKIWEGLDQDERNSLLGFAAGDQTQKSTLAEKLLFAKGLLQTSGNVTSVFSPVFGQYIRTLC
jgi:hypothetical protein